MKSENMVCIDCMVNFYTDEYANIYCDYNDIYVTGEIIVTFSDNIKELTFKNYDIAIAYLTNMCYAF